MNWSWVALAGLTLATCLQTGANGRAEARADEPSAGGVAVVELFTSEGCSSCPPADTLLAELASKGAVYALGFHVDYWDELGWPDRFASPEYTARQRAYARALGGRGLYTPQMIVNGLESFTGSDRAHAERSVARALARAPLLSLSLGVRPNGPSAIAVDCDAPGAPANAVIGIAVVEHSTSTDVHAGENAGRTLRHANVVRAFVVAPAGKRAASTLVRIPASLRRQDAEVIAFVQGAAGPAGMPVLGAARAALPF